MSSNDDGAAPGRQPRSLTLTFAETHPWERLVRDRLNGLPRGYLKRFILLLIERAELDLASDEAFCRQVERALLSRELPGKTAQIATVAVKIEPAQSPEMAAAAMVVGAVPSPAQGARDDKKAGELFEPAPQAKTVLPAAKRAAEPRPFSKNPGFGALEL